jgi:tetratricopeptide (TPR) repeat protein
MNSMFTREFFQIARSRLNPGGVMAQWFHLYNMPTGDLRSLVRSFVDVFPSTTLWQLNEGDVLLTGFADARPEKASPDLPQAAVADLAKVGLTDPELLSTLYVMQDKDLVRFAGNAEPNTDDRPVLEFHGQRNLHLQTDQNNMAALESFQTGRALTEENWYARGRLFEKAESYGLAFKSYREALTRNPDYAEAMGGMIRCARSPEERAATGTLESRTGEALAAAREGRENRAEAILRALTQAYPNSPDAQFNYGLFCLERSRYADAIEKFSAALAAKKGYVPAFEGLAETYLRKQDLQSAAAWSRRILEIEPGHATARQTLARIEAVSNSAGSRQ